MVIRQEIAVLVNDETRSGPFGPKRSLLTLPLTKKALENVRGISVLGALRCGGAVIIGIIGRITTRTLARFCQVVGLNVDDGRLHALGELRKIVCDGNRLRNNERARVGGIARRLVLRLYARVDDGADHNAY